MVGDEVGVAGEVCVAVTGVVDEEVGLGLRLLALVLGDGLREVGEPVDAVLKDLGARGVVEHFDLTLRDAECAHEVLAQYLAVVGGEGHVGEEGVVVVFVGYDEDVGVVVGCGALWYVEVDVVVLDFVGDHEVDGFAEGVVDGELDGRAAVVGAGVCVGAGDVGVVVDGACEVAHVVLEEVAHGLGADVGELAVVGDAVGVDGDAELFVVEGDGHVAEVAVGAVVGDGAGELYAVGGGKYLDGDALGGAEDVVEDVFDEGLGEVADGAYGVGGVVVEDAEGVVVGVAFEVAAVVGDVEDVVELGGAVLGSAVDEGRADGDVGLVIEFLLVGECYEHLLGAPLHGALAVGDVLLEVFAYGVAILVVELLFAGLGEGG